MLARRQEGTRLLSDIHLGVTLMRQPQHQAKKDDALAQAVRLLAWWPHWPRLALQQLTCPPMVPPSPFTPHPDLPPGYRDPGAQNSRLALDHVIDLSTYNGPNHPVAEAAAAIAASPAIRDRDHVGVCLAPGDHPPFSTGNLAPAFSGGVSGSAAQIRFAKDVHVHLIGPEVQPALAIERGCSIGAEAPFAGDNSGGYMCALSLNHDDPWNGRMYFWFIDCYNNGSYLCWVGPRTAYVDNSDWVNSGQLATTHPTYERPFLKPFFYGCRFLDHPLASLTLQPRWGLFCYRTALEVHQSQCNMPTLSEHFAYNHATYSGGVRQCINLEVAAVGGQAWYETYRDHGHPDPIPAYTGPGPGIVPPDGKVFEGVYRELIARRPRTIISGLASYGHNRSMCKGAMAVTCYSHGGDLEFRDSIVANVHGHVHGCYNSGVSNPAGDPNSGTGLIEMSAVGGLAYAGGLGQEYQNHGKVANSDPNGVDAGGTVPRYHHGQVTIENVYMYSPRSGKSAMSFTDCERVSVRNSFIVVKNAEPPEGNGTPRMSLFGTNWDSGSGIGNLVLRGNNRPGRVSKWIARMARIGLTVSAADVMDMPVRTVEVPSITSGTSGGPFVHLPGHGGSLSDDFNGRVGW